MYLFYLLIIVETILVIYLSLQPHSNVSFKNEPFYLLNHDWTYHSIDGHRQLVDLPATLEAGPDHSVIISQTLPSSIHRLSALSILSSHQDIYAYIDNDLIYSKVDNSTSGLFDIPAGNIWVIIPLPPDSEGKTITLKITSKYDDYAGKINEVHAGTKSALLIHTIDSAGINLVISIMIFIFGIIAILVYFFLKKLLDINRSIFFLGWFSLLSSLWMIMECNLMQILIDNEYIISSLTYLSLMTFPIPLILYITLFENFHCKRIIYFAANTFTFIAFILIFLQLFNILDFHESVFIVKGEITILFSIIIVTLLLEYFKYKNKDIKVFIVSAMILYTFGLLELLAYMYRLSYNTGSFFQIGFLTFIIILIWDTLKKLAKTIKLSETAWHYKFLATKDLLTNCRNRVSYAKDMDRISLDKNITIFVADMNNMKAINDTYGHHAGDEAIVLCSQCLLQVFGRRVYRIGGDEFVCIQYDLNEKSIADLLEGFKAECKSKNETSPYSFEMSIGYAVYDKAIDNTIYDTVKRADKDMYENKHKMKQVQ
jgi:diguanylate cyclase (GGDEF)-like protein